MSDTQNSEGTVISSEPFVDDLKMEIALAIEGRRKKTKRWPRKILLWLLASRVNNRVDELVGLMGDEVVGTASRAYDLVKNVEGKKREIVKALAGRPEGEWVPTPVKVKPIPFGKKTYTVLLELDSREVIRVELEFDLDLTPFKRSRVFVQNGRIREVDPGVCYVSGGLRHRVVEEFQAEAGVGWSKELQVPLGNEPFELSMGGPMRMIPPIRVLSAEAAEPSSVPWPGPERRHQDRREQQRRAG